MRICGSRLLGGAALLLATSLVIPAIGHAQTAAYLDHAGLTRELNSLVNGSNLATMESLGIDPGRPGSLVGHGCQHFRDSAGRAPGSSGRGEPRG